MKKSKLVTMFVILLFINPYFFKSYGEPIVKITVGDSWTYEGGTTTETMLRSLYVYNVTKTEIFSNGDGLIELNKIQTNEGEINIDKTFTILMDDFFTEKKVESIYLFNSTITQKNIYHTTRGNFRVEVSGYGPVKIHYEDNLSREIDFETSATYRMSYSNKDLQSVIVTGNPIFTTAVEYINGTYPYNETLFIDYGLRYTTVYLVEGSDPYEFQFNGENLEVKDITIRPVEKNIYLIIGVRNNNTLKWICNYDNDLTIDGLKQITYTFARDIGLAVKYTISTIKTVKNEECELETIDTNAQEVYKLEEFHVQNSLITYISDNEKAENVSISIFIAFIITITILKSSNKKKK